MAKEVLLPLARARYTSPSARLNAAATLGRLGEIREAVENLTLLADDTQTSQWIRRVAVHTLGELKQFDHLKILANDRSRNIHLRCEIARDQEQRGRLGEAMETWLSIFIQSDLAIRTRIEAASEAGRLGYEPVQGALVTWGRDKKMDADLRLESARVLGRLGCRDHAKEILFLLLNQPGENERLQKAATELMKSIDGQTDPR